MYLFCTELCEIMNVKEIRRCSGNAIDYADKVNGCVFLRSKKDIIFFQVISLLEKHNAKYNIRYKQNCYYNNDKKNLIYMSNCIRINFTVDKIII